jgi:patatin-like phospholipase/acyl hydrolase
MSLLERVDRKGPKKLLAIDGGGIRGVLSLEVLQRVETLLKKQSGRADFVLADYFDYIPAHTAASPPAFRRHARRQARTSM